MEPRVRKTRASGTQLTAHVKHRRRKVICEDGGVEMTDVATLSKAGGEGGSHPLTKTRAGLIGKKGLVLTFGG